MTKCTDPWGWSPEQQPRARAPKEAESAARFLHVVLKDGAGKWAGVRASLGKTDVHKGTAGGTSVVREMER